MKKHLVLLILIFSPLVFANAPKVGKAAAARYFQKERNSEQVNRPSPTVQAPAKQRRIASNTLSESSSVPSSSQSTEHFMSLGFGTYSDGTAYKWGQSGKETSVGQWGVDMTYRFQEQEYLFDQSLRVSYNHYRPAGQKADKLSFLYAIALPEATSRFPLYFGGAAGVGLFTKPVREESVITFDYQLYLGVRIFDVYDQMGLYIEGGMRNHLNLTSDGQFNGTFLSLGTVFLF